MAIPQCTAAGCYLQKGGGLVSFPLITIAGLVDSLNPCAIGMLVLLLGYLVVFTKKEKQVFKIGLTYIVSIYITYLAIGLLFYKYVASISHSEFSFYFRKVMGILLILAGLINLKDYILAYMKQEGKLFSFLDSFHLEVPKRSHALLRPFIEKASVPSTIVLGILVTFLGAPCSLPIYAGTATILAHSGLSSPVVLGYFIYYNFLFVLPLIILWLVIWRARKLVEVKEWEHTAKKWMKLALGIMLVAMGIWMMK